MHDTHSVYIRIRIDIITRSRCIGHGAGFSRAFSGESLHYNIIHQLLLYIILYL